MIRRSQEIGSGERPPSATRGARQTGSSGSALERLLDRADVRINGPRPWDPQVHDRRVFSRAAWRGTLGLGEAWIDGWWDCEQLDELVTRVLRVLDLGASPFPGWVDVPAAIVARVWNRQRPRAARRAIARHYEAGNDLFAAMLDRRMMYSCARWENAATLDEAQETKLELTCLKLGLRPGLRLLDIGCGWGGMAQFAAERYGVKVVGITLSPAQAEEARRRCAGLPVEIRLQDYREVRDRFDRIVSIGMLEHVGPRNYRTFMQVLRRCLKDDGLALVHSIGGNVGRWQIDSWIGTYVFPDAVLPSAQQLAKAIEGLFVLEDWHNFGADYDRTLLSWHANVERAWDRLPRYDERFRRMWRYYLLTCAGTFRARRNQLWQIVLSPRGVPGGYRSIR